MSINFVLFQDSERSSDDNDDRYLTDNISEERNGGSTILESRGTAEEFGSNGRGNKDQASLVLPGRSSDALGGIDLNPAMYDMQIKRDENGILLPMSQQPIEIQNIKIDGLFPVIINITPVTHLPILIGASDQKGERESSLAQ